MSKRMIAMVQEKNKISFPRHMMDELISIDLHPLFLSFDRLLFAIDRKKLIIRARMQLQ